MTLRPIHLARSETKLEGTVVFFNLGGGQTLTARVSRSGRDSLYLAIGTVEYHLWVDQAGRVLGGRIPAQEVIVERR